MQGYFSLPLGRVVLCEGDAGIRCIVAPSIDGRERRGAAQYYCFGPVCGNEGEGKGAAVCYGMGGCPVPFCSFVRRLRGGRRISFCIFVLVALLVASSALGGRAFEQCPCPSMHSSLSGVGRPAPMRVGVGTSWFSSLEFGGRRKGGAAAIFRF